MYSGISDSDYDLTVFPVSNKSFGSSIELWKKVSKSDAFQGKRISVDIQMVLGFSI